MLLKVNGKLRFFQRISAVKKLRPGCYRVETTIGNNRVFLVEGGLNLGGKRTDWFLDGFGDKPIYCKSVTDALRCIDNC